MPKKLFIREDALALQAHINIMQSVIQRMASNSASCKAWCITLVSGVLVIVADKRQPQYTMITLIPTILFFVLDAYYLALERGFRQTYNSFIDRLHEEDITPKDLYAVSPIGNIIKGIFLAFTSFSVWPFYLTLLVMILIVKGII